MTVANVEAQLNRIMVASQRGGYAMCLTDITVWATEQMKAGLPVDEHTLLSAVRRLTADRDDRCQGV